MSLPDNVTGEVIQVAMVLQIVSFHGENFGNFMDCA
jgi:hypothetical protein